MNLSQKVISIHEDTSRTSTHVDNFLAKLESIARLTNVEILTDMELLRSMILSVTDGDSVNYKIKSRWPSKNEMGEANSIFKSLFKDACLGFMKTIKRLHGNKFDPKRLMLILNSIEIRDRKK